MDESVHDVRMSSSSSCVGGRGCGVGGAEGRRDVMCVCVCVCVCHSLGDLVTEAWQLLKELLAPAVQHVHIAPVGLLNHDVATGLNEGDVSPACVARAHKATVGVRGCGRVD